MPMTTVAGVAAMILKQLKGAALIRPCASSEVTSAMGRGSTLFISSL